MLCTIRDVRDYPNIDWETACRSFHCRWCGEVCSMMGCGCEWSQRQEVKPADLLGRLPDNLG